MTAPVRRRTPGERVRGALTRAVAIADEPGDDDDVRLRKRVGVTAGYLSIVAPLTLPFFADFSPLSVLLAVALPVWVIANVVLLARRRDFDRYVIALIAGGLVFVPVATFVGGGITGSDRRPPLGLPRPGIRDHGARSLPGRPVVRRLCTQRRRHGRARPVGTRVGGPGAVRHRRPGPMP